MQTKNNLVWFLFALTLPACSAHIEDGIDDEFDLFALAGPSDQLHEPYVLGATFSIYMTSQSAAEPTKDWRIESTNAAVFPLGPLTSYGTYHLTTVATALGEGDSTLRVFDSVGISRFDRTVRVRRPDDAKLLFHGPLILGLGESAAQTDQFSLLAGGTATFMVRWKRDGQTLSGTHVLSASPPEGVATNILTTWFSEDRDWLQIRARDPGTYQVQLLASGLPVRTLNLVVVPPSAVRSMKLVEQSEVGAQERQLLTVLAESFDAQGSPIYGVDSNWELDGIPQDSHTCYERPSLDHTGSENNCDGGGDLYRYYYEANRPRSICARFNGLQADNQIHASGGYVDSTNNVGCSIAPGASAPALATILVLGLLLALVGAVRRTASRRHRSS